MFNYSIKHGMASIFVFIDLRSSFFLVSLMFHISKFLEDLLDTRTFIFFNGKNRRDCWTLVVKGYLN